MDEEKEGGKKEKGKRKREKEKREGSGGDGGGGETGEAGPALWPRHRVRITRGPERRGPTPTPRLRE